MAAPALFGLPMGLRVIQLITELFGISANAFFVFMLLRYCRGWTSSKILLGSYHTAGLVYLLNRFFPLLVASARGSAITPAQCAAPAVFIQLSGMFQLLCMAVMAHYRWKVVQATKDGAIEPDVKRYVYGLVGVVALSVTIVNVVANAKNVPVIFTGQLCVRTYIGWSLLINLTFFFTAPYLIYCYHKIITSIRGWVKDGGSEIVRLIYTLTLFFYISYTPFFILFFIRYLSNSTIPTPYIALQVSSWIFENHAAFSPLLSIMMVKRYRNMAYSLVSGQSMTQYSQSDEKSLTNSKTTNKNKSIAVVVPESSAPEHRTPSTAPEPVEN